MFPFTHIWFSHNVLGYTNNMTVLGSIFPDAFVSSELDYNATHKTGWKLYDYFAKDKPELLDFVKSTVTHTVSPEGLDYYGDESYKGSKGYCFQKAESIVEEVIEACNIPENFGIWKAHNFIEMAIEINILNENGYLLGFLDKALQDSSIMNEIERSLESYYGLKTGSLKNNFKKFQHFVYKENVSSRILSINYDHHMKVRHGINIDIDKASKVIDKAKHIIHDDYAGFLEEAVIKVKGMLKDKIGKSF
ncbi:MAG TPA: hypothetical protein GX498_07400 [Clostridiales bacterium]|nr:hypothetical protein [Clostridiales bacterium]